MEGVQPSPESFLLSLPQNYVYKIENFQRKEGECFKCVFKIEDLRSDDMAMLSMAETDEDLTIPRAAMNKMIKELLPHIRVANDARELILNCCSEFIHHISSEANDICNKQQKKTISAEHVLAALEALGFSSYKEEAEAVLKDCKAMAAKRRRQSTRLENLGIPEEELLRQQQELFARARQEQAELEQQEWLQMQQAAQQQLQLQQQNSRTDDDDDEY